MPNAVGIHSHPTRKKGRRDADHARPAVRFSVGLTSALPEIPPSWPAPNGPWPMDDNDAWGDCVVAMVDHLLQAQATALGVKRANWSQQQILAYYRTQNPSFDPAGSATTNGPGSDADGGMSEQVFLEYLVKTGVIVAFGKVDHTSLSELEAATWLGIAIATGVTVDQAQMTSQFDAGVWDYVKGSPVDGGHAIPLVGKPTTANPVCITWGKPVQVTPLFISAQMDEAWFVLTQPLIDHPAFRTFFNLDQFAAAVSELTDGKVVVPVTPIPAPTPAPTPGPAASFPVAPDVVARITHAASVAHPALTPQAWLDHHLRTYFKMPAAGA